MKKARAKMKSGETALVLSPVNHEEFWWQEQPQILA